MSVKITMSTRLKCKKKKKTLNLLPWKTGLKTLAECACTYCTTAICDCNTPKLPSAACPILQIGCHLAPWHSGLITITVIKNRAGKTELDEAGGQMITALNLLENYNTLSS